MSSKHRFSDRKENEPISNADKLSAMEMLRNHKTNSLDKRVKKLKPNSKVQADEIVLLIKLLAVIDAILEDYQTRLAIERQMK